MHSRITRTPANLRNEDGIALIPVILVAFLMMALLVMVLDTSRQADVSSTRDRNYDLALSVAEAGVHEAIARIEGSGGTYNDSFTGTTPQGTYEVAVAREPGKRFVIEATGSVAGTQTARSRAVKVTLEPPKSFEYALFSNTSIELKNLDEVYGDVWANDSVLVDQNNIVHGSVTAARSYIDMRQGSFVKGEVWAGGFNPSGGWAIKLRNNAEVEGSVKASASSPSTTCPDANYDIEMGSGVLITADATTCGSISGGSVGGSQHVGTYTEAAVPRSVPAFSFNPNNYPSHLAFESVDDFMDHLAGTATSLAGTFYIDEPSPSQSNQIDLTGVTITGDVTIVTDAPVFTNGITDDGSSEQVFVLVSHYTPPTGTSCSVDHDTSECAIHIKNNFDASCKTAVLVYADNGPVAVKNNAEQCGSVVSESILVKNNQELTYDDRISRIVGFGGHTFEIVRWEEEVA